LDTGNPRFLATIKVVAFVLAYIAAAFLLGILVRFLPANVMSIFDPIVPVLMLIILALVFRVFWDREPVATMGLESTPTWGFEFISGFAAGAALITLVFVLTALTGGLTFKSHFSGGMLNVSFFGVMAFFLIGMLFQVFAEEIVFRGYLFTTLKSGWGVAAAVALSAVLFGMAHFFNPGFSWFVAPNLILAGILLALGVAVTGNIWWPLGFHLAWNFFEGYVYGFPVSGLTASSISLFFTKVTAPAWLLGGSFGPEGGLASTIAFSLGIVWLLFRYKRGKQHAGTA
jgi:membrane protease YdiL (CAAX protease family)